MVDFSGLGKKKKERIETENHIGFNALSVKPARLTGVVFRGNLQPTANRVTE